MRPDQMTCPQCGDIAESDSADIGVGTLVRGNFHCNNCGWLKPVEDQIGLIEDGLAQHRRNEASSPRLAQK